MSKTNILKNNSFFGIGLIASIFASPNALLLFQSLINLDLYSAFSNLFHFIISAGVYLFPIIIFRLNIRKYFLLSSPLFFLVPAFVFVIIIYQQMPTKAMFYILFEAQKLEVAEFISGVIVWKIFMVLLPILVILISIWLIDTKDIVSKKFRRLFVGLYIILFVFTFGYKLIQRNTVNKALKVTYRTYFKDSPVNTSKRLFRAFKAYKTDILPTCNHNPLAVFRKDKIELREIYVLVLGESSRYNNWGINGYYRNTSPQLEKIEDLISYKNIISPSFNTNKSVPIIVSTANTKNYFQNVQNISVIDIFKQAGFKTYWISNQTSKGNAVGSISNSSDEQFQTRYNKVAEYDTVLLKFVKEILIRNESKILIVLHTWGSHYPYQNRYPNSFESFTPTVKRNKHIALNNKNKNAIINSYDNSILYTDYFLSELISLINIDSVISSMTYVSDHGENLFDDKHIGFGRGYGKLSTSLFHVPLFFWSSEKFILNNTLKWKVLRNNININCTTEDLIYTITDMAGISWNMYDSTHSFANIHYQQRDRKFLLKKGYANYDKYFWF